MSTPTMQLVKIIERIRHRTEKWGRRCGRIEVDYEDARALLACVEALRKHEPNHIALKWLDSNCLAD